MNFRRCFGHLTKMFDDGVLHRYKSSSLDSKLYQVFFNVHLISEDEDIVFVNFSHAAPYIEENRF